MVGQEKGANRMEKKGLSFFTIISTVICVVFVCEAAAPAAAIGNQQFF